MQGQNIVLMISDHMWIWGTSEVPLIFHNLLCYPNRFDPLPTTQLLVTLDGQFLLPFR